MADLLERKEYLVGLTIIEARGIQGVDGGGTSDPFCKVRCAGRTQQTGKKYETNSAIWNQTLTFSGISMNQYELETFEMNIDLFDHNALLTNELIGMYSIGLSTLYRNTNHEFYKKWITIFNKEVPNKIQGYLLISCFIVGPNERPPFHSADEDFDPDAQEDSDEDEDVISKKIENIKRAQGLVPIIYPGMIEKKYQLTVIITKAEGLPVCETPNIVRPFVSSRAFGCVLTTAPKHNGKPQFLSKLQFPIFYPIQNDKITMRIWHKMPGLKANQFIANIPEHPSATDNFNLSKLLAQDGRMSARWINLYGVKPLERSGRTRGKKEGSQWLGRVLIAFNMVSNERPQFMSQAGNAVKEPKSTLYQLWVDMYEFINCELVSQGSPLWIIVSIGDCQLERIDLEWKEKYKAYKYKPIQFPKQVDITQVEDPMQLPDIFVNVYTNTTFSSSVRIAYLRVKARECMSQKFKPTWFRFQSPYNDTDGASPGLMLLNMQLLIFDPTLVYNPERKKLEKGKNDIPYRFYAQIYQGFEIASSVPVDKLDTRVTLQIGKRQKFDPETVGSFQTSHRQGRYPIWDHLACEQMVQLNPELTFESDMKVTLQNKKSKFFGGWANQVIGEFNVPVISMLDRCDKPQFFNVLNEEGQFMGQVLCNFYLKVFYRDPKTRKNKAWVDLDHKNQIEDFRAATQKIYTAQIDIGLFGLRNLIFPAVKPVISIKLTNDSDPYQQIEICDNFFSGLPSNAKETHCPNFGKVIRLPPVQLAKEPLFWPFIEIKIMDDVRKNAMITTFSGCEASFTTISLIDFADEILEEADLTYEKAQLTRNQGQLHLVQPQIEPRKFLASMGITDVNFDALLGGAGGPDTDMPGAGQDGLRQSMMPGGMMVNQLAQGAGDERGRTQGTVADLNLFRDYLKIRGVDPDDMDLEQMAQLGGKGGDDEAAVKAPGAGGGRNTEDDDEDFLNGGGVKEVEANDLENGVIVDLESIEELVATKRDKAKEESERQAQIDKYAGVIKAVMRKIKSQAPDDQANKDKLRIKMMDITEKMEDLMEESMTEEKFWGALAADDDVVAFDYGRDILKEGTYEQQIRLPYQQLPLFTVQDWFKGEPKPIIQVAGILRSGNPSGASIKAQIVMKDAEANSDEEEEPAELTPDELQEKRIAEERAALEEANKPFYEQIANICRDISDKHPFNILIQQYMDMLNNDRQSYKIRVYLISAQNLTASGVMIDLKSRLAGATALSSAKPYPVLTVGDGINNTEKRILKSVNEREDSMDGNLNPRYFRTYELDVIFPEDWKLEVAIWDKGIIAYNDQMIGNTTIDLENRLFSNLLSMGRAALDIEHKIVKDQIVKANKPKKGQDKKEASKIKKKLKEKKDDIWGKIKKLKPIEQYFIPVEFRELTNPAKAQAQGIVEMWVEVLTDNEAPKVPMQKMQVTKKEKYEIRLIVWETRYVPLVDGDKVDIWVKVTFDPTGWPEDQVEKKTDTHNGSKTGWGQFNWRFKFDLEVPCDFPRIKFNIHDAGFMSDEAIGESTINLKRSINKLEKEGFVEVPKTYISFKHPNKGDEERGILMFSMTILAKEDADGEPVGEAQEEPNENPILKKPTAGRGFGDMMPSLSFNMDFSWNPFGKYLYWILAAIMLGLLFALAFVLK